MVSLQGSRACGPEVLCWGWQLKRGEWAEAVALELRWAAACDAISQRSSQCKAYLAAVVIWLYAQNAREAWACYQVSSPISPVQK